MSNNGSLLGSLRHWIPDVIIIALGTLLGYAAYQIADHWSDGAASLTGFLVAAVVVELGNVARRRIRSRSRNR